MAWKIKPLKVDLISELKKIETNKDRVNALVPFLQREDIAEMIGLDIMDHILERTNKGYDKNYKKFKSYSKSYRASREFKVYKGSQRRVDLKLTGDMQASVQIDVKGNGKLEIKIPESEEFASAKAHGHIHGSSILPVRDFWGLPHTEDMQKIIDRAIRDYVNDDLQEQIVLAEAEKLAIATEVARANTPSFQFDDLVILLGGE